MIEYLLIMTIVLVTIGMSQCDYEFSEPPTNDLYYNTDIDDIPSNYQSPARADSRACKILFLGNSLTYYNAQPNILEGLAAQGNKWVFVDQYCPAGMQLDYHCYSLMSRRKIDEQQWNFVILQEAIPEIASPSSHARVLPFVTALKEMILENNPATRIFYFMCYGNRDGYDYMYIHESYAEHQYNITEGTKQFVETAGIMTAPVGSAWAVVRNEQPEIELYREDGGHPSYAGSYLGASVYYAAIFQENLDTLNYKGRSDSTTTAYLRSVASETVLNNLDIWHISPLNYNEHWELDQVLIPD